MVPHGQQVLHVVIRALILFYHMRATRRILCSISISLADWSPSLQRSRYSFSSPADNGFGKVFKRKPPCIFLILFYAGAACQVLLQVLLAYTIFRIYDKQLLKLLPVQAVVGHKCLIIQYRVLIGTALRTLPWPSSNRFPPCHSSPEGGPPEVPPSWQAETGYRVSSQDWPSTGPQKTGRQRRDAPYSRRACCNSSI